VATGVVQKAVGVDAAIDTLKAIPSDGDDRARSHCRFVRPFICTIPDALTYSVPLFLKRQCDRTPGDDSRFFVSAGGGVLTTWALSPTVRAARGV
jgi:hypothetical protein